LLSAKAERRLRTTVREMTPATQPRDGVGSAAIDDHKCAAAPFDVMPREPRGDLGKRKIGFGHIVTMPDCAPHGRVELSRPIQFVAA